MLQVPSDDHLETCALFHSEPESDRSRLKVLMARLRDIPRTKSMPEECHGHIFEEFNQKIANPQKRFRSCSSLRYA